MKALSGVARVWSGARPRHEPTPPRPPARAPHRALGGRIGVVAPLPVPETSAAPDEEVVTSRDG
ncbi:hypothetical protein [Streptomyces sp. SID11385]|uniref:hypothetical protein n=1 Tax=Streptomyces sp. SID11385 TaxID=2706031 RepID=UPI0013CC3B22|nr:hypothetical protein [Streptomyces sp. SID11385]NEA40552.1 hypothetical protein [Streptomyces sp. SID11385]